jgi:hypothetical protein
MSETNAFKENHEEARQYEIRIQGHLDNRWAAWFEGLTLILEENGDTLISGWVIDQAALFGLLRRVRDAGMLLVSVNCVTASQADQSSAKSE